MNKYTVYFEQRNRTNYQIIASNKIEAARIGRELYLRDTKLSPNPTVEKGWIAESDGEDK